MNDTLSISLPKEESNSSDKNLYTKIIYSKWLGFPAGDYPISRIVLICKKYVLEQDNLCTNKPKKGVMPHESTLYITSNVVSGNFIKKFRFADLLINGNHFHLTVLTSYDDELLLEKNMQVFRIGEDDKLFEKTIDTILINVDNKWIKPSVVRVGPKDIVW